MNFPRGLALGAGPYCLNFRVEAMRVFDAVPIAVIGLPNDAGIGCPFIRVNSGFGSEQVEMARTAFHNEPDD